MGVCYGQVDMALANCIVYDLLPQATSREARSALLLILEGAVLELLAIPTVPVSKRPRPYRS
jgi:hypothetical protein